MSKGRSPLNRFPQLYASQFVDGMASYALANYFSPRDQVLLKNWIKRQALFEENFPDLHTWLRLADNQGSWAIEWSYGAVFAHNLVMRLAIFDEALAHQFNQAWCRDLL